MSSGRDAPSPYAPPTAPTPAPASVYPPGAAASRLRTLGILFHCLGGLSLASAAGFGLLLAFGIAQEAADGFSDPSGFGAIAMVGTVVALSLIGGGLCIWAGLNLMRHTRPTLCTVVAAMCCLNIPFGTVLGVVTLVSLQRADVRAAFTATAPQR